MKSQDKINWDKQHKEFRKGFEAGIQQTKSKLKEDIEKLLIYESKGDEGVESWNQALKELLKSLEDE